METSRSTRVYLSILSDLFRPDMALCLINRESKKDWHNNIMMLCESSCETSVTPWMRGMIEALYCGVEWKLRQGHWNIELITERVQEIERELQAASRVPFDESRGLDDGIKRNRRKRRSLTRLKKTLYQLERECEEIQESMWKLEHHMQGEVQNLEQKLQVQLGLSKLLYRGLEQELHNLKCKFEQKLHELKCDMKKVNCQLRGIKWQRQEFEDLLRVAYNLFVWLVALYDKEDAAHQDVFRNLLLDGWWLEFWEIILLAAGDVEKNPGPRQITDKQLAEISDVLIEEDDLSLVFGALLPVSSKWLRLCCSLGLRASLLDTIKKNHPGDMEECLFEGLQHWILKNYDTTKHGLPSWRRLVEAVDDSSGGHNHGLALEIAEKHKVPNDPTCVATRPRKDILDIEREDLAKRHRQSAAFSRMFSSITRLLRRSVKVANLKQFLRYFSNPRLPSQRYVDPGIYEGSKSRRAKDILDRLYPEYINPENTFLLEEIVRNFGSLQSKKCLEKYTSEYH